MRPKLLRRVYKPYCASCDDHHWGVCFELNRKRYEKD